MKTHKEGYRIVYSAWALFVLAIIVIARFVNWEATLWILPVVLIPLFITRFFRNPERSITNSNNNIILSPCDGKVVSIEKIKWEEKDYWNISVFMSVWNVHINWIPISGKVVNREYFSGKYLVAWHPKSSTENERSSVEILTSDNEKIKTTQIAGAVARRILTYPTKNQKVEQGEELGFIRFGSRVDIWIPISFEPVVKIDDKTQGIITVLAKKK